MVLLVSSTCRLPSNRAYGLAVFEGSVCYNHSRELNIFHLQPKKIVCMMAIMKSADKPALNMQSDQGHFKIIRNMYAGVNANDFIMNIGTVTEITDMSYDTIFKCIR